MRQITRAISDPYWWAHKTREQQCSCSPWHHLFILHMLWYISGPKNESAGIRNLPASLVPVQLEIYRYCCNTSKIGLCTVSSCTTFISQLWTSTLTEMCRSCLTKSSALLSYPDPNVPFLSVTFLSFLSRILPNLKKKI